MVSVCVWVGSWECAGIAVRFWLFWVVHCVGGGSVSVPWFWFSVGAIARVAMFASSGGGEKEAWFFGDDVSVSARIAVCALAVSEVLASFLLSLVVVAFSGFGPCGYCFLCIFLGSVELFMATMATMIALLGT